MADFSDVEFWHIAVRCLHHRLLCMSWKGAAVSSTANLPPDRFAGRSYKIGQVVGINPQYMSLSLSYSCTEVKVVWINNEQKIFYNRETNSAAFGVI